MEACQKAHPILLHLLRVQQKYNKDYSHPSQKTICERMEKYQGVKKSVPTLNRWMRVVEDTKYLIRKRRIKRDPEHGIVFKSTLYKITIKGLRLLANFGVDVRKEIAAYYAWLKEKSPKQDKEPGGAPLRSLDTKRLNQILRKLGAKFLW